jgi:hypothetical protein
MQPHLTRELSENGRPSLLTHFLALDQESRRLRFGGGGFSSDESIRAYVKQIDFTRDAVFGVLDADLCLIGVAHLAPVGLNMRNSVFPSFPAIVVKASPSRCSSARTPTRETAASVYC